MGNHALQSMGLDERERKFVAHFSKFGNCEAARTHSGYGSADEGYNVLRRTSVASAIRYEVGRLIATEGAQIGYATLKHVATDSKAPAAARVGAARALLQAAGLLENRTDTKEAKSINDMSREELHAFIEAKQADIAKIEATLADRADLVGSGGTTQAIDPFD